MLVFALISLLMNEHSIYCPGRTDVCVCKERQGGRRQVCMEGHAAFCLCCSGAAGGSDREHSNKLRAGSECISTYSSKNHSRTNVTINKHLPWCPACEFILSSWEQHARSRRVVIVGLQINVVPHFVVHLSQTSNARDYEHKPEALTFCASVLYGFTSPGTPSDCPDVQCTHLPAEIFTPGPRFVCCHPLHRCVLSVQIKRNMAIWSPRCWAIDATAHRWVFSLRQHQDISNSRLRNGIIKWVYRV